MTAAKKTTMSRRRPDRKQYKAPVNQPRRTRTIGGVTYQLVNGGWVRGQTAELVTDQEDD